MGKRKKQAWLLKSNHQRAANTKPMKPETRERRDRKALAKAAGKEPVADRETGTVSFR